MADKTLASLVFPGLPDRYVVPDYSADIEQIKEDLSDLQEQIDGGSGFTSEFVIAFSNFLDHLSGVFDDPNGQTYIDALKNALLSGESSDGIRFSNGTLWISETASVTATQSGSILTLA